VGATGSYAAAPTSAAINGPTFLRGFDTQMPRRRRRSHRHWRKELPPTGEVRIQSPKSLPRQPPQRLSVGGVTSIALDRGSGSSVSLRKLFGRLTTSHTITGECPPQQTFPQTRTRPREVQLGFHRPRFRRRSPRHPPPPRSKHSNGSCSALIRAKSIEEWSCFGADGVSVTARLICVVEAKSLAWTIVTPFS
jgi:hypothetical protein